MPYLDETVDGATCATRTVDCVERAGGEVQQGCGSALKPDQLDYEIVLVPVCLPFSDIFKNALFFRHTHLMSMVPVSSCKNFQH